MKRKLLIAGLVFVCIMFVGLLVLQIGIGFSVKQNIRLAQQYEIHKAIIAIERRGLISYARLNK